MKRFLDDLVGDVGAVVVAGVDVVDAELNDLAEHPDRFAAVGGRAEDVGTSQLHRAVADARQLEVVS